MSKSQLDADKKSEQLQLDLVLTPTNLKGIPLGRKVLDSTSISLKSMSKYRQLESTSNWREKLNFFD